MSEVVVITGGTAGVGRATARRFARDGATVVVLARGDDGLAATIADIEQLGGKALGLQVDVASAEEVAAAAVRVESDLGPIDIWINNAMTTVFGPFTDVTPAEFQRVTDVCYHGYVWGTRAALAHMRPRNRGTIVQVGSALAYRSIPLQAAYCGAKHAIRGFTDAIRSELIHDGIDIHLTMVQLPAINTPQFTWCASHLECAPQPVPPIFQPEVAADAIHYAAHQRKREIYLGWPTIKALVGQELAPEYADRKVAELGYDGQCATDRPPPPPHPTNLFEPVPGDHGAHGDFDEVARDRATIAKAATRLGAGALHLIAGAAVLIAATAARQIIRR